MAIYRPFWGKRIANLSRLKFQQLKKATIWENTSENGLFFATTFSRPFKDQAGEWRNGTSFGLNDLEALVTVAFEAKLWIAAHAVKR